MQKIISTIAITLRNIKGKISRYTRFKWQIEELPWYNLYELEFPAYYHHYDKFTGKYYNFIIMFVITSLNIIDRIYDFKKTLKLAKLFRKIYCKPIILGSILFEANIYHMLFLWQQEIGFDIKKNILIAPINNINYKDLNFTKNYLLSAKRWYRYLDSLSPNNSLIKYCLLAIETQSNLNISSEDYCNATREFVRKFCKFTKLKKYIKIKNTNYDDIKSSIIASYNKKITELNYQYVHNSKVNKIDKDIIIPSRHLFKFDNCYTISVNGFGLVIDDKFLHLGSFVYGGEPRRSKIFNKSIYRQFQNDNILLDKNDKYLFRDVLIASGSSWNYFHFLFDTIASILIMDQKIEDKKKIVIFNDQDYLKKWQIDLLNNFNIDLNRIIIINNFEECEKVRFHNSYYLECLTEYNIINPLAITTLRESIKTKTIQYNYKKIFISRKNSDLRAIDDTDKKQLKLLLEKNNFVTIYPEELSFSEQISIVSQAKFIICEAGSGVANLAFATPKCKVIILATDIAARDSFSTIASTIDLDLYYVLSNITKFTSRSMFIWVDFESGISTNNVEILINEIDKMTKYKNRRVSIK